MFSRFKIAVCFFFLLILVAGSIGETPADKTSLYDRSRQTAQVIAATSPYNYAKNIDVSSADWSCPDSVKVCYLRTLHPGTIKYRLWRSDTIRVQFDSLEAWPLDIRTIYKVGTDSLIRAGSFTVIGFIR